MKDGVIDKLQDMLKELGDDGYTAGLTIIKTNKLDEAHCDVCRYQMIDGVCTESGKIIFADYTKKRDARNH